MQHVKLLTIFISLSACSTIVKPAKHEAPGDIAACVMDLMSNGAYCSRHRGPEPYKADTWIVPYIDMNNYLCFPPNDVEALLKVMNQ